MGGTLRRRGYKLTPQRRAVLRTVALSQDHLTPAAIYDRVRQQHPGIGLLTVYRTLQILTELGFICEVHAGGSCGSYIVGSPEHHHHLICSNCGKVINFTGCNLSELEQRLSQQTGFEIESHLLEFLGCCRSCQKIA